MDEERRHEQGPVDCAEDRIRRDHVPGSPEMKHLGHVSSRKRELVPTGALGCGCAGSGTPWPSLTSGNIYTGFY